MRLRVLGACAPVGVTVAAFAALLILWPGVGEPGPLSPEPEPASTPAPRPTPRATPVPIATAEVVAAAPAPIHLVLPSVRVSAPVVPGYVDEAINQMIAPEGYDEVAWYEYSAVPGTGGNAVLAGHLDQAQVGPAVLWRLRDVQPGDDVLLHLADGSMLTYRVDFNESYRVENGPWRTLMTPRSEEDVITLYTCDAPFHDGAYLSRRVVRATLVARTQPAAEWHDIALN